MRQPSECYLRTKHGSREFVAFFKVREISPFKDASVVIGFLAFYATHFGVPTGAGVGQVWKMPAPLAVVGGGVLGIIAWATGCT